MSIIRQVFSLHGAVATASTVIGSVQPDTAADAASMLAPSGAQLQLRHELRQPFAAWVARQAGSAGAQE